jgi:DNA repair exonuclease SbcCD nuclease subunit
MSKTLIIGDLHLGKGISIGKSGSGLNSRIIDQLNILNWILETAIEKNVSRFIFTGDFFEELKPDHNLVVQFINWLRSCSDYNIEMHLIAGNHDLKRVGTRYSSSLDMIESSNIHNCFVHNNIYTINCNKASFTLIPFRDKRSLLCSSIEEAIDKLKGLISYENLFSEKKIIVGHLAIEKSFYTDEVDDVSNELMLPVSFFDGWDYVWMGHVHSPQIMNKSNPLVEHVGSMDLSDFGETKHKKILILYDSEVDSIERINIPTRPLVRLKFEIDKDFDPTEFLLNEIDAAQYDGGLKNSIVKLEVKILNPDAKSINRDLILNKLKEFGVFHVSSFSESKAITVVPTNKLLVTDNAINSRDAVKLISEVLEHESEEDKLDFINACNSIIEEEKI